MQGDSILRWTRRLGRCSILGLAIGAGAAGAQDVGVTATEILLGEVQPMSGPASLIGKAGAAGSKLAIAGFVIVSGDIQCSHHHNHSPDYADERVDVVKRKIRAFSKRYISAVNLRSLCRTFCLGVLFGNLLRR